MRGKFLSRFHGENGIETAYRKGKMEDTVKWRVAVGPCDKEQSWANKLYPVSRQWLLVNLLKHWKSRLLAKGEVKMLQSAP